MTSSTIPAATCILLRPSDGGPEVLLLRREPRATFMPHLHVFPGGRVDAADAHRPPGTPEPRPIRPGGPPGPWTESLLSAAPMAAIRESFEEAGVLLASMAGEQRAPGADGVRPCPSARRAIHGGAASFHSVCAERGWVPSLDLLVPFARWVTPEAEPRRFDTLFFVASVPEGTDAQSDGSETVEHRWITPDAALGQHACEDLHLAPPTWAVLRDLARMQSCAEALAWAADCRITPIMPAMEQDENGRPTLLLPGDRLGAPAAPIPSPAGPITRIHGGPGGWHGAFCPP